MCKISGFTIRNADPAIGIVNGEITVCDCIFEDCVQESVSNQYSIIRCQHGSAIYCETGMVVDNCTFVNNECYPAHEDDLDTGYGGAIYLNIPEGNIAVIENSTFNSCFGVDGGAIYSEGAGNISISGCMFHHNGIVDLSSQSGSVACVGYFGSGEFNFDHNRLYHNIPHGDTDCDIVLCYCIDDTELNIINNTICYHSYLRALLVHTCTQNSIVNVINNLAFGNRHGIKCVIEGESVIQYNHSQNQYNDFDGFTPDDTNRDGSKVYAPMTSDKTPVWDTYHRSKCIDAGDPTMQDPDGSRSDVGAMHAEPHGYEMKSLVYDPLDKFEWVCFPIIDMRTSGNNVAGNYFGDMLDTDIIDNIAWSSDPDDMIWYDEQLHDWILADTHQLTYVQGYVACMNANYDLEASGFLAPSNTRIYLETNHGTPKWNWIGYFIPERMDVMDAFESVLDDITEVRTERWSTTKMHDGTWSGEGKKRVLRYGEAVKVYCVNDCDFCWGDNNIVPGDDDFKETKHYVYAKDADYASVLVELDENQSLPKEVAVFLDGECKGASVVEDSLVQINAYVLDDTTGSDIEIELYYGDRTPGKTHKEFAVRDVATGKITGNRLHITGNGTYYVSLDIDPEEIVPAVTVMEQNYPNPFNPTTTIKYSLNQDGPVEIVVYNLKGQKVRQLINANMNAGFHEVVWDGRDSYGKKASSGIYFYRMKTADKTFVKKMMMLK